MQMLLAGFTQEQNKNEIWVNKRLDLLTAKLNTNSQIWVTLKAKIHPGINFPHFFPNDFGQLDLDI